MLTGKHVFRVGSQFFSAEELPRETEELEAHISNARKRIEPWLSAVFQAEHLNLLVGSGFTTAVAHLAGATAVSMDPISFGSAYDAAILTHATDSARTMKRGSANIEDLLRSALAVMDGLRVLDADGARELQTAIDAQMIIFLKALLKTEHDIASGARDESRRRSETALQSFLLSFASRAASRERLHVFTTNYDRLIEHGCDLAGLRTIDRFVGALNPVFRASRVEVDIHYNPPGIRGEPRFMEGVLRLTKLHGSLDWSFDKRVRRMHRKGIPFGAASDHTDMPSTPVETVMIYPNPAKDVETTQYPYSELFRDFAAASAGQMRS
jgi:hypothetical protein